MEFTFDSTTQQMCDRVSAFMEEFVFPAEKHFHDDPAAGDLQWERPAIMADLKKEAKAQVPRPAAAVRSGANDAKPR